ncbi:MAG: FAD-dependent oxidoreductase [Lachnospiraceae bacterium]|jgi:succinate dehydrogenase/fumarate reductase flavoprotein subunit|uniref:FAD-dependent oxidoreductase n=1 Tax=Candidatus Merdisoma sp. JLR.KK011 TaxID=3114299 RepID=UPI001434232D|nr:FAD-dependent oxidoreductase [Lachnospiraceae bacterium]MCI9252260.1 FAD-dependent oxidoreductase [Lachnospiraceae bacterium]MCI9480204.1 FAD-dependent oxidoreductase [Lachnospiraceae bacterium]MCI9623312.1 FAD-dependent oxidoreductase [Lachnospiraceae bacterium]GFI09108.1 8-methylmenaquinol:fumarate reductase flavoprotein subunit [Lachnospiraceae bacterium]
MFTAEMLESIKKVEATRAGRIGMEPRRMTAEEKDELLRKFHPDYRQEGFQELKVGPNKGEKVPFELGTLLHSNSRIKDVPIDLNQAAYDVDVLVIGGGGAGSSAAIEAHQAGANVMMVTKLRIGDANTMMAEGGIQAADKENDSPQQHYLDAFGGGHFAARPELLRRLVMEAPDAIKWLNELGVMFDKDKDGRMVTTHGGGTSRKRMHACKDYSGAEIMRVLRDEVWNRQIPIADFTAAVELIKDDKGQAAGAVLQNMETGEYKVAKAKTVIIATGGAGRLHYQNFPTSNHYGATADGLVMGYRAGAPLLYQDTIQYHPTGVAYPAQIFGALVTEKVRSLGAMLINAEGEAFMHPLETRDVSAASIIRECKERGKGVPTPTGFGIWLDTPMIEMIHGEGTIEKRIPAMLRMYLNYGIDMRKQPILIYPTLHYQNGGLEIGGEGFTKAIPNLLVAGEAVGGIHGRNRLMGNSLLDIIVFGRNAGKAAAAKCKEVELGTMNLDHIQAYAGELEKADLHTGEVSPLLLPKYTFGMPK